MAATSLSVVSSATANRGGVPVWSGVPQVRGKNEVDKKLSVRVPTTVFTYTPTLAYPRPLMAFQWKRDGAAITGATDPVYVTQAADEGKAITCTVTLTGENGSASATTGSTFTSYDADTGDWAGTFNDETTYSNVIVANTATTTYNLATLGLWKTSKTTGSMTAGRATLTVASAAGFTIGDKIIVATGGESGAGAWGTVGVGGTYPTLRYADTTARDADVSQALDTLCSVTSNGLVYQWNGSAWVSAFVADDLYFRQMLPKALVTTISNIEGTTFTLADNAVVNTTNATVYYDCEGRIDAYVKQSSGATFDKRMYVPTGEYAFSTTQFFAFNMKDIYFEGDGKLLTVLLSPDGCQGICTSMLQSQRIIVRKIGFRGNHKMNSAGVAFGDGTYSRSGTPAFGAALATDCLIDNCRSEDTISNDFGYGALSSDSVVRNCIARHVTPVRAYFVWAFNIADTTYGYMIDCQIDSDYMIAGMETFRSDNVMIIRYVGRNGAFAVNTSNNFYVDSPTVTYDTGAHYNWQPSVAYTLQNWSPYQPMLNINSNIANQSGTGLDLANGGTVYNPQFRQSGFIEVATSERNTGIVVAPAYSNVMIKGGTVAVPDKVSGNSIEGAGCDGDGMTVSGTRFIGFSGSGDTAILNRYAATLGHGRAVSCIGEGITARVKQKNQTNAEYIAGGGT